MDNKFDDRQPQKNSPSPFPEHESGDYDYSDADTNIIYDSPYVEDRSLSAESHVKSIVSAIVYPIILTVISSFIYSVGATSLIGFILGIVFSVGMGVSMALGGFYLIIIPLPIISLFKFGCDRQSQSTARKVILGLLTFVLCILVFIIQFALNF